MDHTVVLILIFWRASKLFSTGLKTIYIPLNSSAQVFLTSSTNIYLIFDSSHSDRWGVFCSLLSILISWHLFMYHNICVFLEKCLFRFLLIFHQLLGVLLSCMASLYLGDILLLAHVVCKLLWFCRLPFHAVALSVTGSPLLSFCRLHLGVTAKKNHSVQPGAVKKSYTPFVSSSSFTLSILLSLSHFEFQE